MSDKIQKTETEWRRLLSPEQYRVLREKGTERSFTGAYWNHHVQGTYYCAACGAKLFESATKFDSGCGWPSFWQDVPGATLRHRDTSHGMLRTEVVCARCDSHLGHVFPDGPPPTGERHCINSVCLRFEPKPA